MICNRSHCACKKILTHLHWLCFSYGSFFFPYSSCAALGAMTLSTSGDVCIASISSSARRNCSINSIELTLKHIDLNVCVGVSLQICSVVLFGSL